MLLWINYCVEYIFTIKTHGNSHGTEKNKSCYLNKIIYIRSNFNSDRNALCQMYLSSQSHKVNIHYCILVRRRFAKI